MRQSRRHLKWEFEKVLNKALGLPAPEEPTEVLKTVYCDRHHTRMRFSPYPAQNTWGDLGNGGDCNTIWSFRCSSPDCERRYFHVVGYFDFQVGMRLAEAINAEIAVGASRPRCPEHESSLYLGMVGEGLGYLCPDEDCAYTGPIVPVAPGWTPEIADRLEEVALPPAPPKEEAKAAEERAVFEQFAQVVRLNIDADSVVSHRPRHPDMHYMVGGVGQWIELGEITDEGLARYIADGWQEGGGTSFSQNVPFVYMLESKGRKTYETGGKPVDLLLYYKRQLADRAALGRYVGQYGNELAALTRPGKFRRVWVFDAFAGEVLWCSDGA